MSNGTELRGRIERQLCMFFDEGYDGHLFDAAQAIIDDLGLVVEHGATHGDGWVHKLEDQDEAEQMVRWNPGMRQVSRVIGRWVPVE